jgi:hypothetical protein
MPHTKLVALGLAAAAGLFITAQQADAQQRLFIPHGGGGGGALRMSPGMRGPMVGSFRGSPRYAMGPAGNSWRWHNRGYGPRYGYWGGRRWHNNGWGWAGAGLVGGLALGALASSSYPYDGGYYGGYSYPVSGGLGNYCQTPVRTCLLYNPAELGVGCSCRVAGGRAGGVVIP